MRLLRSVVLLLTIFKLQDTLAQNGDDGGFGFEQEEQEEQHYEEQEQQQQQQQGQQQRIKMAPESQRILLESVTGDCYELIYQVINGEMDQRDLSEQCNKELMEGYAKTPMGQLQQKEMLATQTAAILRVTPSCRAELEKSQGGADAQPSESCVEDFQKQFKEMQNWVARTTVSRMSNDCKTQISSGNLDTECEAEFLQIKPSVVETLENQNAQKMKEPPPKEKKEAPKDEEQKKKQKRPKPVPPMIDPGTLFFLFWSIIIGGAMTFVCIAYYRDDRFKVPIAPIAKRSNEDDDDAPLSKSKQKEQRRLEKKQKKMANNKHG